MRVGQANFIPTIRGEVGGTCSCGSCHVYVDPEWLPKLKPPHELEQMMIDSLELTKRDNSRLTCMILVTPEWTASCCACSIRICESDSGERGGRNIGAETRCPKAIFSARKWRHPNEEISAVGAQGRKPVLANAG